MTSISQKEYLKKYLGIGKAPGEKRKKKKKITGSRVQIIDDDADANLPTHIIEDDPLIVNEDAPQIVAIIDERPPSLRVDEKTKNPLWQPIGSVDTLNGAEQKPTIAGFKIAPKINDKQFAHPADVLLPKRRKREHDDDYSPPRKFRDDNSPPRKFRGDSSPLRNILIKEERRSESRLDDNYPSKSRTVDDDDNSPPRRSRIVDDDNSPPRRTRIVDDDSSPPIKRRTVDDRSLPRRSRIVNDNSPRRRNRRVDQDNSPPRRSRSTTVERSRTPDSSPPRRVRKSDEKSRHQRPEERKVKSEGEEKRPKKMDKTLDGKAAGLQDARLLVEETKKFRSREEQMFKTLPKEASGENAETVHRDRKTGKIRNLEEEEEHQRKKREEEEKNKEKYLRWGRGLVQVESRDQQIRDELHEMSKPLARYADDEDLERYLKEQEREGDPMLAYIRGKKRKDKAKAGVVEKPQFEGQFMPNRFGIKPGHRWDGVDRSNGYEKKWFEVQNAKKAQQEDTYKWSTEDM
jgi:pre-mRNA-splicing factor CWC26